MYLGVVPLLTRGPIAMMYGGEGILEQLSPLAPDRGTPVLLIVSTIFQISLFTVKKVKSREVGSSYLKELKQTMVEGVTNVYSLVGIMTLCLGCLAYGIHHEWTSWRNRATEVTSLTPSLLPTNIAWALTLMAFCTLLPFCTQHALRWTSGAS